ncbi:AraC family transcriptional regulator [Rhodocaloribacter litoris]|uniref:helix-turn-helix transcriptional regulator n=1 Tax=Rhodocaloribacter litoris TaxID=2558931 RepID=UPI00141DFB2F|nr:AraC family transcriptional regulator [Rhodocaloribacter litoris]QXD13693.1 AraC family transcriptional regulator [Rhodocaloribacter litoris]
MNELIVPNGESLLKIEVLFVQLLSLLFSNLYENSGHTFVLSQKDAVHSLELIERAKQYIHLHFRENISLTDVSKAACLSEYHFVRVFRKLTGWTPYRYLLETRLQHALLLLQHTKDPVTQICFHVGFNNLSHFITTFRKRFGVTPSQARKLKSKTLEALSRLS